MRGLHEFPRLRGHAISSSCNTSLDVHLSHMWTWKDDQFCITSTFAEHCGWADLESIILGFRWKATGSSNRNVFFMLCLLSKKTHWESKIESCDPLRSTVVLISAHLEFDISCILSEKCLAADGSKAKIRKLYRVQIILWGPWSGNGDLTVVLNGKSGPHVLVSS